MIRLRAAAKSLVAPQERLCLGALHRKLATSQVTRYEALARALMRNAPRSRMPGALQSAHPCSHARAHAPSRSICPSLSSSHPGQVTYVCSPGHKLVGPAKKKCTQQGYWAPGRVPQCKVIIKRENDNSFENNDAGWVIGQSNL